MIKQIAIYLALITMVFHSSCNNAPTPSTKKYIPADTTKSFKIDGQWATPRADLEFDTLGKASGDTLDLIICSEFVFSPFGIIENKSQLKSSLLKNFTAIDKNDTTLYEKDTLVFETQHLTLKTNKLVLFFNNDSEASRSSYINKGEINDSSAVLINNIKTGMGTGDFYKTFFEIFPAELQKKYHVILLESCVEDIIHIYTFKDGKLASIKFEPY